MKWYSRVVRCSWWSAESHAIADCNIKVWRWSNIGNAVRIWQFPLTEFYDGCLRSWTLRHRVLRALWIIAFPARIQVILYVNLSGMDIFKYSYLLGITSEVWYIIYYILSWSSFKMWNAKWYYVCSRTLPYSQSAIFMGYTFPTVLTPPVLSKGHPTCTAVNPKFFSLVQSWMSSVLLKAHT